MKTKFILLIAALGLTAVSGRGDDININFETNVITGGSLNLIESGIGSATDFGSDRFDELTSADFEITDLPTYGTLTITATALLVDLNVTGDGLQDGSSGYGASGEGTSFIFDKDVIITGLDWGSFTTAGADSVTISNGATGLGTFSDGTIIGDIDFSNTNAVAMNLTVSSGDAFTVTYGSGNYFLEDVSLTVIPEPSSIALIALTGLAALSILRRRKA